MTDLHAMLTYAQTFELAYMSDDWSILAPLLAEDAIHIVRDGGPVLDREDRGHATVIDGFREAVHAHDRRFDLRIPEILEGPQTHPEGVWMRFRLTTRRESLPDLSVEGEHLVRYRDGKIVAIEERILSDGADRASRFFEEHARHLRPTVGGPLDPAQLAGSDDVERAVVKSMVRAYGAAKSEQDIGAALAVCHPDFWIETVSFGIKSRDREDTGIQLAAFFDAFPDYKVSIEGLITEGHEACLWGRARMTLSGAGLGVEPTGRTADLPIFCTFETREGMLTSERFFFDMASLCSQIGVPAATFEKQLKSLRAAA